MWAATFRNATSIAIPAQPVKSDTVIAELFVEDLSLNEIDPVRFINTMQVRAPLCPKVVRLLACTPTAERSSAI